jgi:hypothetical protein
MSDAVHVIGDLGYPISPGNPFPVDAVLGSNLSSEISKISASESEDGRLINESLLCIIELLKINNAHLQAMTGERINNLDMEV